ncbi:signal peptide peptidase SppA [Bacteroidia bacterium]|nr:signal peptide peptidase SppA [Bacteroidia bacterium]
MKNFLKMVFASTLGVFIAGGVMFFLSFVALIGIIATSTRSSTYELHDKTVLSINLDAIVTDRVVSGPFDFLELGGSSIGKVGLNNLLTAIKKAEENDKIKGIYLKGGMMLMSGYATVEPIRKALLDFKKTGKFIIAYAENYTQAAYAVCSVADSIFMNPQGVLDFRGLARSIQFNKRILEKWGIEMQVYKVGTYKSAVEPYTEQQMSAANREQVTAYLGDIWKTLLTGISESRGISVAQLNQYADECLTFVNPQKVVDYKLIDGLKYSDEVEKLLKAKVGVQEKEDLKLASVKDLKFLPERQIKSRETIAVLYAEGEIVSDATPSFFSGGENIITAKEYVKELKKLQKDDDVKAVVFRVNSPGGSAFASEQIWHAVQELRAVKPIVVSMGDVAASGGYYISAGANEIFAEPTTITGSIGIFGMIPNGAQLAKRMGATYDGVSTNKHSNFAGDVLSIPLLGIGILPARPLTDSEGAMLQAYVERGYDTFLSRCAAGRHKTKAQIDAIGQGRVWTGNQALDLGLIDQLGGLHDAIEAAAKLAAVTDYSTREYPAEKDFFAKLLEESGNNVSERVTAIFLGSERLEQKRFMNAWSHYDYRQAIFLQ